MDRRGKNSYGGDKRIGRSRRDHSRAAGRPPVYRWSKLQTSKIGQRETAKDQAAWLVVVVVRRQPFGAAGGRPGTACTLTSALRAAGGHFGRWVYRIGWTMAKLFLNQCGKASLVTRQRRVPPALSSFLVVSGLAYGHMRINIIKPAVSNCKETK